MTDQQLQDPLLEAVRKARPAIDDAALSPASENALTLLERVLSSAEPRGPSARRGRPPIWRLRPTVGLIGTAAIAGVAVVAILLSGLSGTRSLVDRAYAAIDVGDQLLHEVDLTSEPRLPGFYDRVEGWLRPADGRARLIEISGYRQSHGAIVNEWLITATGRVFARSCLSCRSGDAGSFINGHSAWSSEGSAAPGTFGGPIGDLPGTYARWFRAAYRAHAIVPAGATTFAGRRVARFQSFIAGGGASVVAWRPGTRPPATVRVDHNFYALVDWYIDPATARPVGFGTYSCSSQEVGSCKAAGRIVRIVTFQRLGPTAESLALLTGPGAPLGAR